MKIEKERITGDASDINVEFSEVAGNIAIALIEESLKKGNEVYIPSLNITLSGSPKQVKVEKVEKESK